VKRLFVCASCRSVEGVKPLGANDGEKLEVLDHELAMTLLQMYVWEGQARVSLSLNDQTTAEA
jgi:hypothetical protein